MTPNTAETTSTKYWAFISYRHSDNTDTDRDWASWLHQSIETYEVPAELIGTQNDRGDIIPERIYPVFRDEESLPADSNLAGSITNALDNSQFLVALCSPRAVESQYVAQEIEHFKSTDKGERIIAGIIAGEPGDATKECFPEPLREVVNKEGKLSEPIAADFRLSDGSEGYTSAEAYKKELLKTLTKKEASRKAEKYDGRLQLMKLKIIAGILGIPLETIRDRDKAYQLLKAKQRQRIFVSVIAVVSILALASGFLGYLSYKNAEVADKNALQADKNAKLANDQKEIALANENEAKLQKTEAEKQRNEAETQRLEAEKNRREAIEKEALATKNLARSDFLIAFENWQKRQHHLSLAYLARSLQNNPLDSDAAQLAWSIMNRGQVHFPDQAHQFQKPLVGGIFNTNASKVITVSDTGSIDSLDLKTSEASHVCNFDMPIDEEDGYISVSKSSDSSELKVATEKTSLTIDAKSLKFTKTKQEASEDFLDSDEGQEKWAVFEIPEAPESQDDGYATDGWITVLDIPPHLRQELSQRYKNAKGGDLILMTHGVARFESTLILINENQVAWLDGRPAVEYHYLKSENVIFIERSGYYGSSSIEALILDAKKPFLVDLLATDPEEPIKFTLSTDQKHFAIQHDQEVIVMSIDSLKKRYPLQRGAGRTTHSSLVESVNGVVTINGQLLDVSSVEEDLTGKILTTEGVYEFNLSTLSMDRDWQGKAKEDFDSDTLYPISGGSAFTTYGDFLDGRFQTIKVDKISETEGNKTISYKAADFPLLNKASEIQEVADDGSWFLGHNFWPRSEDDTYPYQMFVINTLTNKLLDYSSDEPQELLWTSTSYSWLLRARMKYNGLYVVELFTDITDPSTLIELPFKAELKRKPGLVDDKEHIYVFAGKQFFQIPKKKPSHTTVRSPQQFKLLKTTIAVKYNSDNEQFEHDPRLAEECIAMNATGLQRDVFSPNYKLLEKGHSHIKYCIVRSDWGARGNPGRLILLSNDQSKVLDNGYSGMTTSVSAKADAAVTLNFEDPAKFWCPTPHGLNDYKFLPELLQHYSGCSLDKDGKLTFSNSKKHLNTTVKFPCQSWPALAKFLNFQVKE